MSDIKIFEKLKNIDAGFTTAPDDAPEIRDRMALEAEKRGGVLVRAKLVHGTEVACIFKDEIEGMGSYLELEDVDALLTELPDVTLTTTHADCIPVFVCDPVKGVAGLAHAGWRGTADCVVSCLIGCMTEVYGCSTDDIRAYIGPGIEACCFEVDSDVMDYFTDQMPWTEDYVYSKGNGKYCIDLKGINCELLEIEGVKAENIEISRACSCCGGRFHSYRRDKTKKRMLAYIRKIK